MDQWNNSYKLQGIPIINKAEVDMEANRMFQAASRRTY